MSMSGYSALCTLILLAGAAWGQEIEPNDTCPGQHIGMPTLPFSLTGSLDTPPDDPDVDFYRFDFTAGDEVVAGLEGSGTGAGTLTDPLMGLFDSDCNLIRADDDGGGTLNARLFLQVPDDGVVILAATTFSDFSFEGNGFEGGSYTLTIADAPPLIHSITGRLVDAQDGQPITGDDPTFAGVSLSRCENGECREVAFDIPDARGRFTFSGEVSGLRAGRYQLAATAVGYQDGQLKVSERFQVGPGQQLDFGDLLLRPDELQITRIDLCHRVPADGGVCVYSIEMRNRGPEPFSGRIWSLVDYGRPDTGIEYAFQVGAPNAHMPQPKYVWVEPEAAEVVTFFLRIPPDWPALDGDGYVCVSAGIGRAPFALQNVVAGVFIGCLTQAENSVEWIPQGEVRSQLKASGKGPMMLQGVRPKRGTSFRR